MISHLLVTTKAYDVRAAVAGIAHLLAHDGVLLLLVNGMGLAEQLGKDWPQLDIYCGTSTEGAYTLAPQHIRHAGRGETRIGRQGQSTAAILVWPVGRRHRALRVGRKYCHGAVVETGGQLHYQSPDCCTGLR